MTFSPTQIDQTPAVCFCCGREATGIGLGAASRANTDPRWLCEACVAEGRVLFDAARRDLRPYERQAVTRAMEAVGPLVEANGSDLAEWDETQVEAFISAIWRACGDGLREAVREGCPF